MNRVNSDGTYDITFDDGDKKRGVRKDQIKGAGDAGTSSSRDNSRSRSPSRDTGRSSSIKEGDRVEAKVAGWT